MQSNIHHFAGDGNEDDGNAMERFRDLFGPGQVDRMVRGAIQTCWMALPAERRTPAEVEREIRRVVDRALGNLRQDFEAFGRPGGQ